MAKNNSWSGVVGMSSRTFSWGKHLLRHMGGANAWAWVAHAETRETGGGGLAPGHGLVDMWVPGAAAVPLIMILRRLLL